MNKIATGFAVLLVSAQSLAQFEQMNFEKMAAQAAEMQQCMEKITPQDMADLEQQAKQFEKEIKTLCANGQRDEAQSRALSLAMEMNNNETIGIVRDCTKDLSGMMEQMMPQLPATPDVDDLKSRHICD
jgi:rhodanese-related sulfurtransferase